MCRELEEMRNRSEQKGLRKGIEQGKDLGILENRKTTIQALMSKGFSPADIADMCDYPKDVVLSVAETMV